MVNECTSFPIVVMKEGNWYVASCPQLDIATQGKTEQEVKENMEDLIEEYLEDEDTLKSEAQTELKSLLFIYPKISKKEMFHGKTQTA